MTAIDKNNNNNKKIIDINTTVTTIKTTTITTTTEKKLKIVKQKIFICCMRIETILFRDTIRNDDCNNSFAYLATNFMSWQTKKTKNKTEKTATTTTAAANYRIPYTG